MEYLVAQFRSHTLLDDHVTGDLRRFAQIVTSTGRNSVIAIDDLFSDTAAQRPGQDIFEFVDVGIALVLRRQEPRNAAGTTTWDDSDFVHRIAVG